MSFNRRRFIHSLSALALIPFGSVSLAAPNQVKGKSGKGTGGTPAPTPAPENTGKLCMGLFGPTYYGGFNPFLNWWKLATPPSVALMNGSKADGKAAFSAGYLSAETGELVIPVSANVKSLTRIFFAGDYSDFTGESWIVRWDGTASCVIGGLTQGGQITTNEPGLVKFTMGTKPGNTWATFTVTNLNDPPRNIRIYQARYAASMDGGGEV